MQTLFLSSNNAMVNRSLTTLPAMLLLGGFLLSSQVMAAVRLACPPSLPISAALPRNSPGAWKVYIDSPLYLNSAAPISGPPETRGELADYVTRKGRGGWTDTYQLDGEFPDGKWLQCGYGTHNEATLSMKMPDTVKACTFTYRKGEKAGQNDVRIDCR
jgi:hypothetical protein